MGFRGLTTEGAITALGAVDIIVKFKVSNK